MTIEEGAASVGGNVAQPPLIADTGAPAAIPPASPLEPNSGSYFDRMQTAVAAADAGVSLEDQAREVAASVSDAPVSGDESAETPATTTETPETSTETPTEEAAPEEFRPANIPYEQLPDNIRAELRRANLAPEVKEALAQSWYERKAFHDVGFSVEQARYLKSVGFSPEVAVDRLRLHPTTEDAATDANLANVARTLINDFQSNPSAMLDGLRSNVPEAFPGFAEAVVSRLKTDAPQVYGKLASTAMFQALQVLESEYPAEDFESREKIAFVKGKLFEDTGATTGKQPGAFDPNDPIHQKYKALEENQHQQHTQQATAFVDAVNNYSQQAVLAEVSKRVGDAFPKGIDPSVVQRAATEITELVAKDFFGNRGVVESLNQAILRSDLSQESLNSIVGYAYNRAVPLIAVHAKPVLEFWTKNTRATTTPTTPAVMAPPHSAASSRTVANAPSAARVPAAASPIAGAQAPPPKEFIANGRKQGWDTGRIISAWMNGQR